MRYLLYVLCVCAILGCDEETADPVDFSRDLAYYPVELNRPLIYAQDSIVLVATVRGIVYDTARSQVRETLVEQFVGADGEATFRGERWQRRGPDDSWRFVQTYTIQRTTTAVKRTEDNLTFTKLIFPIRPNRSWDGNVAFDQTREVPVGGEFLDVYNNWAYRYGAGPVDTTINGITLPATQVVNQADVDNFLDLRKAYERYTPGVGLVERFIDARHTQCRNCCNVDLEACSELPWDEKAEKGYIIHQTLLERR